MADNDLVRVKLDDGAITTVGRSFATSKELEILTDEEGNEVPGQLYGRTPDPEIPAKLMTTGDGTSVAALRGEALNDALTKAELSLDGKLAEKQQRLADHLAGQSGQPA